MRDLLEQHAEQQHASRSRRHTHTTKINNFISCDRLATRNVRRTKDENTLKLYRTNEDLLSVCNCFLDRDPEAKPRRVRTCRETSRSSKKKKIKKRERNRERKETNRLRSVQLEKSKSTKSRLHESKIISCRRYAAFFPPCRFDGSMLASPASECTSKAPSENKYPPDVPVLDGCYRRYPTKPGSSRWALRDLPRPSGTLVSTSIRSFEKWPYVLRFYGC